MLRILYAAVLWLLLLIPVLARFALAAVRRKPKVLEIVLEGHHALRHVPAPFFARSRAGVPRRDLAYALRQAARDPTVHTVWVRVGHLTGGFGELHALREALVRVKAAGKRVVASLNHGDTRALFVASVADEIIASPHITLDARGMALEMTFFGGALDKAGVGLDVITAGAFKSAMEPFTRTGPSPASAEALEALLNSLYDQVIAALGARPGRTPEAMRAALEAGPHLASEALALGLVDTLLEEEAVPPHLGCGEKGPALRLRVESYPGPARPWPRWRHRRPQLALVEVHGNIRDGRTDDEEPEPGANANAVCAALDRARRNKRIRGVLLHVDSRGGSATASERMWRSVRALAAEKPVIACMGDYAASGGYYVACAAHGIVAAPGTLTGSIGVISAKPVAAGLFEKLGITHARFERGENSTMYSPAARFTEGQRAAMERTIRHFYGLFLSRVAEGRHKQTEDIAPVAEGRVWTGAQALERGLVDRLGDEEAALVWLRERTGLETKTDAPLLVITPRMPWRKRLMPKLAGQAGLIAQFAELASFTRLAAESPTLAFSPWRWGG